jgi:hypothetical protein
LALHGVTNRERVNAELHLYDDRIRLVGEHPVRLPYYRIRQESALAGAIQLRDQIQVSFDIVAVKEES